MSNREPSAGGSNEDKILAMLSEMNSKNERSFENIHKTFINFEDRLNRIEAGTSKKQTSNSSLGSDKDVKLLIVLQESLTKTTLHQKNKFGQRRLTLQRSIIKSLRVTGVPAIFIPTSRPWA